MSFVKLIRQIVYLEIKINRLEFDMSLPDWCYLKEELEENNKMLELYKSKLKRLSEG